MTKNVQRLANSFSRNGRSGLVNKLDGDVVHDWKSRGGTTHFTISDLSNLVVCERIDEGPPVISGKGGRICEYDWHGNIV